MASGLQPWGTYYLSASPKTSSGSRGEALPSSATGLWRQLWWEQINNLPANFRAHEVSVQTIGKHALVGGEPQSTRLWLQLLLLWQGFGQCNHPSRVLLKAKKHVSPLQLPTQTSLALSSPRRAFLPLQIQALRSWGFSFNKVTQRTQRTSVFWLTGLIRVLASLPRGWWPPFHP